MILWSHAAYAATLSVPSSYPTLADALEVALPGDIVELAPGVHPIADQVHVAITIRGAGPDQTVLSATADPALYVEVGADLVLEGVRLEANGWHAIETHAPLRLEDVEVTDFLTGDLVTEDKVLSGGIEVHAAAATLVDTRLLGPGGVALDAFDSVITLDGVLLQGLDSQAEALVQVAGGQLTATDVIWSANAGAQVLEALAPSQVALTRAIASCNIVASGLMTLDTPQVTLGPLVISENTLSQQARGTGLLKLTGEAELRHAVIRGVGDELALSHTGPSLAVWDSVFADLDSVVSSSVPLTGGHDLFWSLDVPWPIELAAGSLELDPTLIPVGLGCQEVWAPGAGSPLLGAGSAAELDRNGTPNDIGATGGPASFLVDADGDGSLLDQDCDDTDEHSYPAADEQPYDGVDQDCDGQDLMDVDDDGYDLGEDCSDTAPTIHPGATEIPYDNLDQDCSGADLTDVDGDGQDYWSDCDDEDAGAYFGNDEIPYDGIDNDCLDGDLADVDGDGYDLGEDCDDSEDAVHPGATEIPYDLVDQDCLGGDLVDVDGDGASYVDDCDDDAPELHPGAQEVWYDGIDSDCDGASDFDQDGDGFDRDLDCSDTVAQIHPGAVEDAGPADLDCDGLSDPTVSFELRGCSTAPGPALGWLSIAALLLARRR